MNIKICIVTVFMFFISGCSSDFSPFLTQYSMPQEGIMYSAPSIDTALIQHPDNLKRVCMGRGADAAVETSKNSNFSLSFVSTGNGNDSEGTSLQDNTGEEEMTGRTPAVLIARELFYRACEFSTNFRLTKEEAVKIYESTLKTVEKGWVGETKKTTVTIGDTLTNKNDTSFSESDSATSRSPGATTDTGATLNSGSIPDDVGAAADDDGETSDTGGGS